MKTRRSKERFVSAHLGWPLLIGMLAACSDSTNPAFDGDSGSGGSSPDAGADAPLFVFDSGGVDSSLGADSGSGDDGSAAGTDAAYAFDGFAKPDGSSYCFDSDGDGFTTCAGDCNDHDSLVNPCAFDSDGTTGDSVGTDGIDNDCDGVIDNRRICDGSLVSGHGAVASDYATAADICDNAKCTVVTKAAWYGPVSSLSKRITKHMGNGFSPHAGSFMAFMSTGISDDLTDTPGYRPGDGTDLLNTFVHPSPLTAVQNKNPCGQGQNEANVSIHDYSELRLTLTAPINAGSFTFDFNFFSTEYPAYACRGYNDTFLVMLTSKKYQAPTQIAFDPGGGRINVNNSFFSACNDVVLSDKLGYTHTCQQPLSTIAGTGYDIKYGTTSLTVGNLNKGSGATNWLKTSAPIEPGETFTLSFIVFDEGDGILDSAVNIDNFRWGSASIGSPVTGR